MDARQEIEKLIRAALKDLDIAVTDVVLEYPADISFGDFATNVALVAAKQAKKNPRECAERIRAALLSEKPDFLEKIEVAGPGFINFFLSKEFFADFVASIDEDFGTNRLLKGKKILVEHSSPNLFKDFHVGHVMNNAVGESMVRLARFSGAKVSAMSYPSDISLGVGKAMWAFLEDGGSEKMEKMSADEQLEYLSGCYVRGTKTYEENPAVQERVREITAELYEGAKTPTYKAYEKAKAINIKAFKSIVAVLGSRFSDKDFIYESQAGKQGMVLVEKYIGPVFTKSAESDAVIYEGEKDGLHTRVFINKDSYPTYEAKEIGLFYLKSKKYDPDISISVTDHEQESYFKVVIAAAKKIKETEKIASNTVHRTHGRMTFKGEKMSSRLGGVPRAKSILDFLYEEIRTRFPDRQSDVKNIALAALKFPILRASAGKNVDFDPESSLSFEGSSGPYLQYGTVRASSILSKAKQAKISAQEKIPQDWSTTTLEKYLVRFPTVVERSVSEWSPHHVVGYLLELTQIFNGWYGNTKIVDEKDPSSPYKVFLTKAFHQTMQSGLYLLGIEIPDKM